MKTLTKFFIFMILISVLLYFISKINPLVTGFIMCVLFALYIVLDALVRAINMERADEKVIEKYNTRIERIVKELKVNKNK